LEGAGPKEVPVALEIDGFEVRVSTASPQYPKTANKLPRVSLSRARENS